MKHKHERPCKIGEISTLTVIRQATVCFCSAVHESIVLMILPGWPLTPHFHAALHQPKVH